MLATIRTDWLIIVLVQVGYRTLVKLLASFFLSLLLFCVIIFLSTILVNKDE